MFEALSVYTGLGHLEIGLLLFPVGLVVGSFCSVLRHRVARGQSIVSPRSRCPVCNCTLGARDLVPLISFLCLRGRCRYCSASVSWSYPAMEAVCGLVTCAAGVAAGWAGGLAALVALPALAAGVGIRGKVSRRVAESGFSLVEVLVAIFILTLALVPALETIAVARKSSEVTYQRAVAVSLAYTRVDHLVSRAQTDPTLAGEAGPNPLHGDTVSGDPSLSEYRVYTEVHTTAGDPEVALPADMRLVKVTVICLNCRLSNGRTAREVVLSTLVGRKP